MNDARATGGAFRIGTVFGIPIRIHFTFLLLLVWWGAGSASAGRGFLDGVVFILLVFACVVLHELGHAAAGRHFGVQTREIVLYPIGGVARLDRIPAGMAEFWIALAGPAVNFILGSTLLLFLLVSGEAPTFDGQGVEFAGAPLIGRFVFINFILFAFNLFIPAFPMDGGRALRAGLSVFFGQARATRIAARIGQAVAVLMAVLAVIPPVNPVGLLIAFFVFIGAGQEAAYERNRSAMAGLSARDAMITRYETIAPQESLGRAAELLLSGHQQDFPVVDAWGRLAGLLPRGALLAALAAPGGRERAVLEVMEREPQTVPVDMPLETVLRHLQSRPLQPILVIGEEAGQNGGASGLVGMITLDNLGELIQITQSSRPA
jgi:Zn-dependent protease/CBS domain-containing protein